MPSVEAASRLSPIFLYDSHQGKKRLFRAKKDAEISVYGCGPTVYDLIHVGNARAFLTSDLLVRVFELAGYKVNYARNYTDVDDKIIKRAKEKGLKPDVLASENIKEFEADMRALKVREPEHKPSVSGSMDSIVSMIKGLVDKNHAYSADTPWGKDVYFRVSSYESYGELSGRHTDDLANQSRIEPGEAKESPLDFALWKAAKEGEPSWESPWGLGRPGWHIECSAMIDEIFPDRLDVHMGGSDLIFPHHENEIAQSQALCSHKRLAEFWVHNGMLQLGQEKMSKSLGNFLTLRDFLKHFGAEVLRLLIYQVHYRSPVDFSRESLLRTEHLLEKIYHYREQALEASSLAQMPTLKQAELESAAKDAVLGMSWEALRDDLNTAKALGILLKEARRITRDKDNGAWRPWLSAAELWRGATGILDTSSDDMRLSLKQKRILRSGLSEAECERIEAQLAKRIALRAEKNFAEADKIRESLESQGIVVMDGPEGSAWDIKGAGLEAKK